MAMSCEVDLNIIRHRLAAQKKPVLLMAKANCYGLGLPVAKAMQPYVCGYGAAFGEEGVALRAICDKPILITTPRYRVQDLLAYRLTPVVSSVQEVRNLGAISRPLAVHIKLNTGLNRFGVDSLASLGRLLSAIDEHPYLYVGGVMTHYASAQAFAKQNRTAWPLLSFIYARVGPVVYHSEATSTAEYDVGDMVRLGMLAYRDSVTLRSEVLAVRRLSQGDEIGYDGIYTVPQEGYYAVVAGGYADGISRAMRGSRVWIGNTLCPIVAVFMDVCLVQIPTEFPLGTPVILLGKDVPDPVRGLYEMYTNIGQRFTRTYIGSRDPN